MIIDAILMQMNLKINHTMSPEGFADFIKLVDKSNSVNGQSVHDIVNAQGRTKQRFGTTNYVELIKHPNSKWAFLEGI
jgi:hypothetical protein